MGGHVGCDVEACSVFSLNNSSLPADVLDGIKDSDPDTGGDDSKEAGTGALFQDKDRSALEVSF